jgi:hypothetical protein
MTIDKGKIRFLYHTAYYIRPESFLTIFHFSQKSPSSLFPADQHTTVKSLIRSIDMALAEETPGKDYSMASNVTPEHLSNPKKSESHAIETEDVEGVRVLASSVASSESTAKIGKQSLRINEQQIIISFRKRCRESLGSAASCCGRRWS